MKSLVLIAFFSLLSLQVFAADALSTAFKNCVNQNNQPSTNFLLNKVPVGQGANQTAQSVITIKCDDNQAKALFTTVKRFSKVEVDNFDLEGYKVEQTTYFFGQVTGSQCNQYFIRGSNGETGFQYSCFIVVDLNDNMALALNF